MTISISDLDKSIWEEELEDFVPNRIYDIHTHMYDWDFYLNPGKNLSKLFTVFGRNYPRADRALLNHCDALLMPSRQISRLSFPFPFPHPCDFDRSNHFVFEQNHICQDSGALMLVHPKMSARDVEIQVVRNGFLGFKPYRVYSVTGDATECGILDFLPEYQIEVADRLGLIIMMHISKREGIADPQNIGDLEVLSSRYPNAKWILAHCARSYSSRPLEKVGSRLRALSNVWYDTSSVCDAGAIATLCDAVGINRVMYGSDDVPVGIIRGKAVAFGFAWSFLYEHNHDLELSHCRGEMTFVRYEQLRAMRQALRWLNASRGQIQQVFFDNANSLVRSVNKTARIPPQPV